jgi:hypothetical protein
MAGVKLLIGRSNNLLSARMDSVLSTHIQSKAQEEAVAGQTAGTLRPDRRFEPCHACQLNQHVSRTAGPSLLTDMDRYPAPGSALL